MKFRYARHTTNLASLKTFYVDLLGLEILGSFENHDNYDGLFIGENGADWHLEFTVSTDQPNHQPDEDDLLVFYFNSLEERTQKVKALEQAGIQSVKAINPYWNEYGMTYEDPDGFRVVLALLKNR